MVTTGPQLSRFDKCLRVVFGSEGGWSDNPNDAGGKTNFGITEGTLRAAFADGQVGHDDIRKLTRDEAAAIYRARYWDAAHCDEIPEPVDLFVFDAAVNCGVRTGVKFLQSALVFVTGEPLAVDGGFGPATRGAMHEFCAAHEHISKDRIIGIHPDVLLRLLALAVLAERTEYYLAISDGEASTAERRRQEIKNRTFLRGWFARVERLTEAAGI